MPLRQVPKRENVYIGIDPGASGGIAAICGKTAEVHKMPATEKDLYDLVMALNGSRFFQGISYGDEDGKCFAYLEQVGGYIGSGKGEKGGGAANGSAMFKFGMSFGMCRMALTAAQFPWELITPQRWQKLVKLPPRKKGEGKSEFKNRMKGLAQRLFPGVSLTLATCDAVLIAEACRRTRETVNVG